MGLKQDRGATEPGDDARADTGTPAAFKQRLLSGRRDLVSCPIPAVPVLRRRRRGDSRSQRARERERRRAPRALAAYRKNIVLARNTMPIIKPNTMRWVWRNRPRIPGGHALISHALRLRLRAGIGRHVDMDQWRCLIGAARSASQSLRRGRAYSNEVQPLPLDSPTRSRAAA